MYDKIEMLVLLLLLSIQFFPVLLCGWLLVRFI